MNHPLSLFRVTVNVLDVNDNSPVLPVNVQMLNISGWSVQLGARFSLLIAFDADVGSLSVKSYKLSSSEQFSLDVNSGGEHIMSAELVLWRALDREKEPVSRLVLTS